MTVEAQPLTPMPFGCSAVMWVGGLVFVALMIVTLVPGVMEKTAAAIHCAGAGEVITDTQKSESIAVRGGGSMATTTTDMLCVYQDGRLEAISNDKMFMTSVGAALALGSGLGLLIAFMKRLL